MDSSDRVEVAFASLEAPFSPMSVMESAVGGCSRGSGTVMAVHHVRQCQAETKAIQPRNRFACSCKLPSNAGKTSSAASKGAVPSTGTRRRRAAPGAGGGWAQPRAMGQSAVTYSLRCSAFHTATRLSNGTVRASWAAGSLRAGCSRRCASQAGSASPNLSFKLGPTWKIRGEPPRGQARPAHAAPVIQPSPLRTTSNPPVMMC